jgi:hypothetical protein
VAADHGEILRCVVNLEQPTRPLACYTPNRRGKIPGSALSGSGKRGQFCLGCARMNVGGDHANNSSLREPSRLCRQAAEAGSTSEISEVGAPTMIFGIRLEDNNRV